MSPIGRALKKQFRTIKRYKQAPILSFKGFDVPEIIVFSIYCTLPTRLKSTNIAFENESIQREIDTGKYKDIKDFDGHHSPDIEFNHLYFGPFLSRYNKQTKKNLIALGQFWRKRLNEEYPETNPRIVVYFFDNTWFLDVFNYDIEIESGVYL